MKKKVFCLLLVLALISVVILLIFVNRNVSESDSNNDLYTEKTIDDEEKCYNTYSYITDEMKANANVSKPMALFRHEYTPKYMLELSDTVAIVTIVSIEGASTEYNNMFGMTYGTLLIENIIAGDIIENETVGYLKPGGILTMSNWEKTQPQAANEKREYLREQSGTEIDKENTYISIMLGNDIELETGKTYLAYLNYNYDFDKYEIIGLGNGLRELNVQRQIENVKIRNINSSSNELQIKNNTTGEWESLNEYIHQNIGVKDEYS